MLENSRLSSAALVDWTTEKMIDAYRSLPLIEETFKRMKNIDFLR